MHFLDAWTELSPLEFLLIAAPVALSLAALALRRLRPAALAAGLSPLSLTGWPGHAQGVPVALLWVVGGIAVAAGAWRAPGPAGPRPPARSAVEGGLLAAALTAAWLGLLAVSIARQNVAPVDARDITVGVTLMAVGLLHLLLRRELSRAALAFLSLGLGLAVLEGVAHGALPPGAAPPGGRVILLGTLLGAALALHLAGARAVAPGSTWVSDAHDLGD